MKRYCDLIMAFILMLVLGFPMLFIALIIKLTSRGPVLYWSNRVGRDNHIFRMPKFRTMKIDTPEVATHLLTDPNRHLTWPGRLLRRSSMDELPQLISILKGDMGLVGPRPALFNQDDLVALRTEKGIDSLRPGLTGWAQINGRDELPIPTKVALDEYYLLHKSFAFDLAIIAKTLIRVWRREGVSH